MKRVLGWSGIVVASMGIAILILMIVSSHRVSQDATANEASSTVSTEANDGNLTSGVSVVPRRRSLGDDELSNVLNKKMENKIGQELENIDKEIEEKEDARKQKSLRDAEEKDRQWQIDHVKKGIAAVGAENFDHLVDYAASFSSDSTRDLPTGVGSPEFDDMIQMQLGDRRAMRILSILESLPRQEASKKCEEIFELKLMENLGGPLRSSHGTAENDHHRAVPAFGLAFSLLASLRNCEPAIVVKRVQRVYSAGQPYYDLPPQERVITHPRSPVCMTSPSCLSTILMNLLDEKQREAAERFAFGDASSVQRFRLSAKKWDAATPPFTVRLWPDEIGKRKSPEQRKKFAEWYSNQEFAIENLYICRGVTREQCTRLLEFAVKQPLHRAKR